MSKNARGTRPGRGLVSVVSAGAVVALAAAGLAASPAQAADSGHGLGAAVHRTGGRLPHGVRSSGSIGLGTARAARHEGSIDSSLARAAGRVDVMLELDAAPAAHAFGLARRSGLTVARAAAKRQSAVVESQQAAVVSRLRDRATAARVLYRAHALYAGVAVTTDASRLRALAALPGVKAVHRLVPKSVDNSSSVPLIGAPAVWKGTGQTGQGVRVGIIDTGIDYTHADFGGAGTTAAYAAAKAAPTFAGTAKVVGGYDFAGDAYDPDHGVAPTPDANPLDCEGHGSHVAGTTAGYGVNADGSTYTGSYAADLDPAAFRIGPGVAPGASLYALKVFGCDGSTNLVTQALDWAADPNGDGDVSDHLDVVNMSLGSSYGSSDDPDAVASDNLAALGTVVVASMGNSGDVYEVGGSPGNATRVLAVAASDDGNDVVDGLKVDSPSGIEPADTVDGTPDDVFAAMRSSAYDWANQPGVSGSSVVTLGDWSQAPSATNNTDGCSPLSAADRAKVAGKTVLLFWDDAAFRCGSAARSQAVAGAGAVGAVLGSSVNAFSAGIYGTSSIPVMLTVKQAADAIRTALASGPVTVTLSNALRNAVTIRNAGAVDQLASFSSRGTGRAGAVKPDVAAPGVTTFSVAAGSGNEGIAESGTSMASPHVAGEAALVRGAHRGWSVEDVKAAIMNTATQDVYVGPNHTGAAYGPERVGSGRVKADAAVATQTLAYAKDTPGAVSVSFGPLAVTRDTTLTRTIHVVNRRTLPSATVSYALSYAAAHTTPGATYTVSPSSVTVPPGGSADVQVTLHLVRSQLRHVSDPTADADPAGLGLQRSYRTDASGRVLLTPTAGTSGPALRVPVWSAPRPASAMGAARTVTVPNGIGRGSLALGGLGVDQGSGATGSLSTVSSFELQTSSPRLPRCAATTSTACVPLADDQSADLRYVGAASDAPAYTEHGLDPLAMDPAGDGSVPPALLSFGITAWGPWRTPASATEFDVMLDTNADGTPDAAVYNTRVMSSTDDFDYFLAETVDLASGDVLDDQLVNLSDGSFDTDLFNSDSLTMSVSLAALKDAGLLSATSRSLRYWVQSFTGESGGIDTAAPSTFTWASPGVGAVGDSLAVASTALPGLSLEVRRDAAGVRADKPLGLYLIHHLNVDGARAQVVTVKAVSAVRLTASSTRWTYGAHPVLTATVAPYGVTGTVTFRDGTRALARVAVSGGKAAYRLGNLARGAHSLNAVYSGDAVYAASVSARVPVTVVGLASRTTLTSSATAVRYGGRPYLTATVAPTSATGVVVFRDGSRVIGTAAVSRGKAVLRTPVLARGTHYLTATYAGSSVYAPSQSARLAVRVS